MFLARSGMLLTLTLFCISSATAESFLQVKDAWVRQPPPNASATAGYLTIVNPSDTDYYITGAESERFGAIELHESVEENGMARMIHHNFYRVPAKSQLDIRPGSYHLMLFRWQPPLKEGEKIHFQLKLGNGDRVPFTAVVKRP